MLELRLVNHPQKSFGVPVRVVGYRAGKLEVVSEFKEYKPANNRLVDVLPYPAWIVRRDGTVPYRNGRKLVIGAPAPFDGLLV